MKTIKILGLLIMSFLVFSCVIDIYEDEYPDNETKNVLYSKELLTQPPQWLTLDPCHEDNICEGFKLYREVKYPVFDDDGNILYMNYDSCIWLREPTEPWIVEIECILIEEILKDCNK